MLSSMGLFLVFSLLFEQVGGVIALDWPGTHHVNQAGPKLATILLPLLHRHWTRIPGTYHYTGFLPGVPQH